jgi:hypothetical protein
MVDYHEEILKLQKQQESLLQLIKDSGISVSIEASDIKIGAVEIQDKEDGLRADVESMDADSAAGQNGIVVKSKIIASNGARINPRAEDGHGSENTDPSFVEFTNALAAYNATLDRFKMMIAPEAIFSNVMTLPDVLPDQDLVDGVIIKANKNNVDSIFVNGFELEPGESVPIAIDNLNKVLVTGTAGEFFSYIGS